MSIAAKDQPANVGEAAPDGSVASGEAPAQRQGASRRLRGEITSPSLDDLIEAYYEEGSEESRPRFERLRKAFEAHQGASIEEQYFTVVTRAAAVLLRANRSRVRRIKFSYDSGIANPKFDELMRDLHSEQLQSSILLRGLAQRIVVQRIYAVIGNLLSVLATCQNGQLLLTEADPAGRLNRAVDSARKELESIREFVREATRRQALGGYLAGFPAGVFVSAMVVTAVAMLPLSISRTGDSADLAVCLGAGAIGAMISVMARITGGKQLDIDSEQTRMITALAGAFRPIVGAVFGAILYALILGGLLPLNVPNGTGAAADIGFFFAAIAFLAGFSERWAQDTIVQSTPGVGRRRNRTEDREPQRKETERKEKN